MMNLAGRRHWYAAVIRTRDAAPAGYATPVVAVPVAGDAFVILPYGEGVDWLKNVLAAGRAAVEAKGETYDVFEPEVIDAGAALPAARRATPQDVASVRHRTVFEVKRTRRDLGAARWDELRAFQATHPLKHIIVDGVGWDYIASGEGERSFCLVGRWSASPCSRASRPSRTATGSSRRATPPCPPRCSSSTGWRVSSTLRSARGARARAFLRRDGGAVLRASPSRAGEEDPHPCEHAGTAASLLWLAKVFLAVLPLVPVGWLRALRERGSRAFYGVPSVPMKDQAFWHVLPARARMAPVEGTVARHVPAPGLIL